jgi:DNA-binding GntR family transcriptional regulator
MRQYPSAAVKAIFKTKIKKQPPLRVIVYEQLKNAILSGAIPKGEKLYESKIALEMGISRTPVREALHALERELLVVGVDKVGYEIPDVTPRDLEEISEIRKTVEELALKEAIELIGEQELRQLEDNLKKSEQVLKDDPQLFVHLDAEFHGLLCSLSGSKRLTRMADTLRQEMVRFRNRMKFHRKLCRMSLEYHKTIVGYLKTKDYGSARKVLIDHIDSVKEETRRELLETK